MMTPELQEPRIEQLLPVMVGGYASMMSYATDATGALWRRFMIQRGHIEHAAGDYLYSVQVFPEGFFEALNPERMFEKRAVIPIGPNTVLPSDMDRWLLPGGLYAVFHHVGSHTDLQTFQYIFTQWLPYNGIYELDDRPHFECLGPAYRQGAADSEEDIYIPIRAVSL